MNSTKHSARSEDVPEYMAAPGYACGGYVGVGFGPAGVVYRRVVHRGGMTEDLKAVQDRTILRALEICEARLRRPLGDTFTGPQQVKDFLRLRLANLEAERFDVLYLTSQHTLIRADAAFTGTLTATSVYPREIVKRALALNAAAVIFAHNHPSGVTDPSQADKALTKTLKAALAMVDVRVIDHVIVGGMSTCSFAETGLM